MCVVFTTNSQVKQQQKLRLLRKLRKSLQITPPQPWSFPVKILLEISNVHGPLPSKSIQFNLKDISACQYERAPSSKVVYEFPCTHLHDKDSSIQRLSSKSVRGVRCAPIMACERRTRKGFLKKLFAAIWNQFALIIDEQFVGINSMDIAKLSCQNYCER